MSTKYTLLSFLFLLCSFSIQAQEIDDVKTNSTKVTDTVKQLTERKKTKKEKRLEKRLKKTKKSKPSTTEPSQTKPSTTKPVLTKPAQTKPTVSQNQTTPLEVKPQVNTAKNETPQVSTTTPSIAIQEKDVKDILETKPNGSINWTQQYVEAKGQSVIDTERFKNKAQANAMATRGAVVVAQRNLLEMVQGVSVVGETTVEDMITVSDYIYTRVEGFVKGAEQIGPAREVNGLIEVTLRMPIYGSNGIAGAFEPSDITKAKSKNGYKISRNNLNQSKVGLSEEVIDGTKPFVFNIQGKKIDPSMFPVVIDDEGNIEFDFSELYETKTGKFPKFVQLTKEIMNEVGYQKGVDVIDLIQNGKGEFKLPKDNKKRVFWQKLGNVAKVVGQVLFNIAL